MFDTGLPDATSHPQQGSITAEDQHEVHPFDQLILVGLVDVAGAWSKSGGLGIEERLHTPCAKPCGNLQQVRAGGLQVSLRDDTNARDHGALR